MIALILSGFLSVTSWAEDGPYVADAYLTAEAAAGLDHDEQTVAEVPTEPIDLCTASLEALLTLPCIGRQTAQDIVLALPEGTLRALRARGVLSQEQFVCLTPFVRDCVEQRPTSRFADAQLAGRIATGDGALPQGSMHTQAGFGPAQGALWAGVQSPLGAEATQWVLQNFYLMGSSERWGVHGGSFEVGVGQRLTLGRVLPVAPSGVHRPRRPPWSLLSPRRRRAMVGAALWLTSAPAREPDGSGWAAMAFAGERGLRVGAEQLLGGQLTHRWDARTALGVSGYGAQGQRSNGTLLWPKGYPQRARFAFAGVHGRVGVGAWDAAAEYTRGDNSGDAFIVDSSLNAVSQGGVALGLRLYGPRFDNPHARGQASSRKFGGSRFRNERMALASGWLTFDRSRHEVRLSRAWPMVARALGTQAVGETFEPMPAGHRWPRPLWRISSRNAWKPGHRQTLRLDAKLWQASPKVGAKALALHQAWQSALILTPTARLNLTFGLRWQAWQAVRASPSWRLWAHCRFNLAAPITVGAHSVADFAPKARSPGAWYYAVGLNGRHRMALGTELALRTELRRNGQGLQKAAQIELRVALF